MPMQMASVLYRSTYVFLALPYVVFLIGWIRLPYSILLLTLLAIGCAAGLRGTAAIRQQTPEAGWVRRGELISILLPLVLVFVLCGVGGWGYQDRDWLRGNIVLRDLVAEPWPVVYETETGPLLLVYYSAFYLPAALLGKLLGWQVANHALFLYGFIGLLLSALWVTTLTGIRRWWCVPVFLAFSGMDVIGALARRAGEIVTGAPTQSWTNLEWWAGFGSIAYVSNLQLLTLTPNQAIPAWLVTALIVHDAREDRIAKTGFLYLGVASLWAPYVCIGLVPFVLALTLPDARRGRVSALLSWGNAAGVLIGLTVVGYLGSRYWPYTMPIDVSKLYQEHLTLTLFRQGPIFLGVYPLFIALEFGILHVMLYSYIRIARTLVDPALLRLLRVSSIVLCILPWINLSWNNDIVMRASIPMLFVTVLVAIRVLGDAYAETSVPGAWLQKGVVAVLMIGWLNAAWIAAYQVRGIRSQGALIAVPDERQILSLFELQRSLYDGIGYNFVGQYIGSTKSPFSELLLAARERDAHP